MKKVLLIGAVLFLIVLSSSCSNDKKLDDRDVFNIYYIDGKTYKLESEDYVPEGNVKEVLVSELLDAIRMEPKNVIYRRALPDNIAIKEAHFSEDGDLIINFENTYSSLVEIPEVLCRAAIIKTLTQIEGVEYIEFYVNDQPLMDSNGDYVGLMTKESFIESTGMETVKKITLYFAGEDGESLIESVTNINYTGTGSLAEQVITSLINGPTKAGMYATIPEGTTLLNITSKESEGLCYVDFNEIFLEKLPDITSEVAIYSIVNSLVELSGINKVQFMINGSVVETYQELAFNGLFERNLTLVTGEGS